MTDALLPHDAPYPGRPHRVYVALTTQCNRRCPWCSTCSSPQGRSFISPAALQAALPADRAYELQLEGGEPTLHPRFDDFVAQAGADARCRRLVICSNGTTVPRDSTRRGEWLARLPPRTTLKLSVNHHLLEHDPGLLALAAALAHELPASGDERRLVINVRLRRGVADDDRAVREAVAAAGLLPASNVFYLQRYGFARDESTWDLPRLAGHDFRLINPDGSDCGTDLIARAEAMRGLP